MSEKMTLAGLLAKIQEVDEGMVELSNADLDDVFTSIKDKVDGIREMLSRLESEEERLDKIAKQFASKKKAISNSKARLKEYCVYILEKNETPQLFGHLWDMKIRKSEAIEVAGTPSASHALRYPDLVRTKVEWDKTGIKERVKKGEALDFAKLKENLSVSFTIHKESK